MNKYTFDILVDKIGLLALGALIVSIYVSWSDSMLVNAVHLDPNDVFDMGFMSRLLFCIFGIVTGTVIGLLGYIPKIILEGIGNASNNGAYTFWGWCCPMLAIIGGVGIGVKIIAHWMY